MNTVRANSCIVALYGAVIAQPSETSDNIKLRFDFPAYLKSVKLDAA